VEEAEVETEQVQEPSLKYLGVFKVALLRATVCLSSFLRIRQGELRASEAQRRYGGADREDCGASAAADRSDCKAWPCTLSLSHISK